MSELEVEKLKETLSEKEQKENAIKRRHKDLLKMLKILETYPPSIQTKIINALKAYVKARVL